MAEIISMFAATLITVPLLSYLIAFIVTKQITKNHRRSVHFSADCATLFLILSVHYMIKIIWGISLEWVLFIVLLLIAVIVSIANYKYRDEIDFFRVFKGFWRVNFLLFFIAYIILIIYGTIHRVTGMLS